MISYDQFFCKSNMAIIAIILVLGLSCVTAAPSDAERIVGGSVTTISQYPSIVSMLNSHDGSTFWQSCGGTIINTRSILTAAHCTIGHTPARWRARVGSTFANSGGVVHNIITIVNHPNYNSWTQDNDIAIVRTASNIAYVNNAVQAGLFAGANYNAPDGAVVWAAGWGRIAENGPTSEQLRHVQIWTINQAICRTRYGNFGTTITDNMLCSGWLDVGGRDQCSQDSGGPLYHNNVVIGVCSFGIGCGRADLPGVNARVSRYAAWIQANA